QHRDERGEPTGIVHRDVSPQNVLLSFAGEMLAATPPPSSAGTQFPASGVPQTRDRVVTQSVQDLPTPTESPLRYDLDEGRPTVAGWRSPRARGPGHAWLWAFGASALLAGVLAWFLFGS
ncbi:MAG: hypothetical protein JRH14_04285, partial [Deltaproteobacteria bacterium]|nr:hypothetical protein [Deltaproteobacteria bacterium]